MFITCYKLGMRKTIKAKISERTNNTKLGIVERELERWQDIMHDKFEKGITEYSELKKGDRHSMYASYAEFNVDTPDHPMPIHNQDMQFERKSNCVAEYWFSIPTLERHGRVYVPVEIPYKYYGFEEDWNIRDSEVTKEDGDIYIHINIEKEIEVSDEYAGVLGVDLGVRHVAVTWNSVREKPRFHGKKLRQIRGKYSYLRKKLQSDKKLSAVQRIKDREHRKVDNRLHNISRKIVDRAKEDDLAIMIGDLSGHREGDAAEHNSQIHSAPTYELKQQIKYKAHEEGILCEVIDEAYTTVTCSSCGYQRDSRPGKEFSCPECGYTVNSDVNGAKNITERGFGYMSESEAGVVRP